MNNTTQTFNILFCGTGGQGVLKASEVCGVAALASGYHVMKSEVHGMAQRGGSVESHLRFGPDVASPLIMPGRADFLVCFHADEAKRLRHFLKDGGVDFTKFLDETAKLPDSRFINTLLLGVLASFLPLSIDSWHHAIETVVGKRIEENKNVFDQGLEIGRNSR